MKKIMIFPYHPDIETFLQWKEELINACLYGVCSYKEDDSIIEIVNAVLENGNNAQQILKESDVVLLVDNYRNYKNDKYYEIIEQAIENEKEVLVMPQVAQRLNLDKYKDKYKILQKILDVNAARTVDEYEVYYNRKYDIDTPIIAVTGMGKNSSKFECQLMMKTVLEKEGYKVCWVTSNEIGCLFRGYSMPRILYDNAYSFEQKIIGFNHYIYKMAEIEKPDVILIGIPEGIAEFATKEYNHFGEYPTVIGNAINIDSAVLCTYYMDIKNINAVEKICDYTKARFFIPVHVVCIGRNTYEESDIENSLLYSFLDEDYLEQHFTKGESAGVPIYALWREEEKKAVVQEIERKLQSNIYAL